MGNIHIFLFAITSLGAIYMLYHGLMNAGAVETVTGAGFALIGLAVFIGFDMQDKLILSVYMFLE